MWLRSVFKRDDEPPKVEGFGVEQENASSAQDTIAPEPDDTLKRSGVLHKFILWTKSVLTGDILAKSEVKRHYPYAVFLLILALLYITHIFSVQQLHREHLSLTREIKDLRAKSLTLTSYRMQVTRHSNIINMLKERGSELEESLTPNIVISK